MVPRLTEVLKRSKMPKKTAVKRRECANFPKRAIDIDCPHFGPDTPGHAAIGPTNYLKTFPVAPENVRICPCIWTLTVKNRPKNGQDADRCCDVAWVLTGAPTMLGCLVWVPASSDCPKRRGLPARTRPFALSHPPLHRELVSSYLRGLCVSMYACYLGGRGNGFTSSRIHPTHLSPYGTNISPRLCQRTSTFCAGG